MIRCRSIHIPVALCIAMLGLLVSAAFGQDQDVAGLYQVRGFNPSGVSGNTGAKLRWCGRARYTRLR